MKLTSKQSRLQQPAVIVRIVTLSRDESQKAYRFNLWGQETLVISDCPVTFSQHQLRCSSKGLTRFELSMYPAPRHGLQILGTDSIFSQKEGQFETYLIELPEYSPEVSVTNPVDKSAILKFTGDWPPHVQDVWLEIDYEGDVAEAFLNGELITDHIQYGNTWFIGLQKFYTKLETSTLHLSITPVRKGTVHTFVNQAQIERFEGVEMAEFHNQMQKGVLSIPQYTFFYHFSIYKELPYEM